MRHDILYSGLVLIATAAVLFYVAFTDLRHYRISNELITVLGVLFLIHSLVSGRWASLHWNIGFALLMFVFMIVLYARGLMGGGDVKLLTIAFLWVGIGCALPFAVLLLVFAGVHAIAGKLGWIATQISDQDGRQRIPFAPSIASALIGVFMLGCLAPAP